MNGFNLMLAMFWMGVILIAFPSMKSCAINKAAKVSIEYEKEFNKQKEVRKQEVD